jgi:hypothetical protein
VSKYFLCILVPSPTKNNLKFTYTFSIHITRIKFHWNEIISTHLDVKSQSTNFISNNLSPIKTWWNSMTRIRWLPQRHRTSCLNFSVGSKRTSTIQTMREMVPPTHFDWTHESKSMLWSYWFPFFLNNKGFNRKHWLFFKKIRQKLEVTVCKNDLHWKETAIYVQMVWNEWAFTGVEII